MQSQKKTLANSQYFIGIVTFFTSKLVIKTCQLRLIDFIIDIIYKTNVVSFRFNVTEIKCFLLIILTPWL